MARPYMPVPSTRTPAAAPELLGESSLDRKKSGGILIVPAGPRGAVKAVFFSSVPGRLSLAGVR